MSSSGKNVVAAYSMNNPIKVRRIPIPMYSTFLFLLLRLLSRMNLMKRMNTNRWIIITAKLPIIASWGFTIGLLSIKSPGMVNIINTIESNKKPAAINRILSFLCVFFICPIFVLGFSGNLNQTGTSEYVQRVQLLFLIYWIYTLNSIKVPITHCARTDIFPLTTLTLVTKS